MKSTINMKKHTRARTRIQVQHTLANIPLHHPSSTHALAHTHTPTHTHKHPHTQNTHTHNDVQQRGTKTRTHTHTQPQQQTPKPNHTRLHPPFTYTYAGTLWSLWTCVYVLCIGEKSWFVNVTCWLSINSMSSCCRHTRCASSASVSTSGAGPNSFKRFSCPVFCRFWTPRIRRTQWSHLQSNIARDALQDTQMTQWWEARQYLSHARADSLSGRVLACSQRVAGPPPQDSPAAPPMHTRY